MNRQTYLNPAHYPSKEAKADALLQCLQGSKEYDYIGEPISQLDHALQTASCALTSRSPDAVVLGALFHDIGHLIAPCAPQMAGLGVVNHEHIGAALLRDFGCSKQLADLVKYHVEAKRYLCFKKPNYFERLSEASRKTLQWQGGPMTAQEASEFEKLEAFRHILSVRAWDEKAKDPHAQVPPLGHYRPILLRHLNRDNRRQGFTDV